MKHVLIVDDDRDMQSIYRYMLRPREAAITLHFAADAHEAMRILRRQPIDAVISDIIMKGVTGDSFIAHMKSDRAFRLLPVLVVTVLHADTLGPLADMPGVSFLQKPIANSSLLAALDRLLAAGGAGGAKPGTAAKPAKASRPDAARKKETKK